MHLRSTLLAVAVIVLTACSQNGELSQQASREELWQRQQAMAGAVQEWNMYARAVLKLEGEAYNIGIRWQRKRNGSFMILLEAPFGQGVFRIDYGGAGDYRLLLPDGQSFRNTTAEALLEDAVGWSLPISGLDAWIRGLPHARSEHSRRLDSSGRARSIRQDGWDIIYQDYSPGPKGAQLPRRLRLVDDPITFKLAIEHWQPPQSENVDADLFPSFD